MWDAFIVYVRGGARLACCMAAGGLLSECASTAAPRLCAALLFAPLAAPPAAALSYNARCIPTCSLQATHIFDGLESWPSHVMYVAGGRLQVRLGSSMASVRRLG